MHSLTCTQNPLAVDILQLCLTTANNSVGEHNYHRECRMTALNLPLLAWNMFVYVCMHLHVIVCVCVCVCVREYIKLLVLSTHPLMLEYAVKLSP